MAGSVDDRIRPRYRPGPAPGLPGLAGFIQAELSRIAEYLHAPAPDYWQMQILAVPIAKPREGMIATYLAGVVTPAAGLHVYQAGAWHAVALVP